MRRMPSAAALALMITCVSAGTKAVGASTPSLTKIAVTTTPPTAAPGFLATSSVKPGQYIRITAEGVISMIYGPCGRTIAPTGCGAVNDDTNSTPVLVPGVLAAAFYTSSGAQVGPWQAVGSASVMRVPVNAAKLYLEIFGIVRKTFGSYEVTVDILPEDATQRGSLSRLSTPQSSLRNYESARRAIIDPSAPQAPVASLTGTRTDIHHLLRRLGFSASPEDITAIQNSGGVSAWVAQQTNPTGIDDSALTQYQVPLPVYANSTYNQTFDNNSWRFFETRLLEGFISSKRQLLQKMTWHWLQHFSVDYNKVGNVDWWKNANMPHYTMTVQNDAMGNFKTLLSDVTKEYAMQYWLDEAASNGNDPASPPNENLGREIMQLYSIGINKLNLDGTPVLDNAGNPVPAYTETDVKQAALLLTGYTFRYTNSDGSYPAYADDVAWVPDLHHTASSYTIMGQTVLDPGGAQCAYSKSSGASGPCVIDNFVNMLAHQPTTWAYESKEILQRLVTENPSPAYVQRIATVWGQNVDAPNQIALVMKAVALDPEFQTSKYAMAKEPIEFILDYIRAFHGATSNPLTLVPLPNHAPYHDALAHLQSSQFAQDPYYPGTVFGFYRPGNKMTLYSTAQILNTLSATGNWLYDEPPRLTASGACSGCDSQTDLTLFANSTNGEAMTDYLLDALVDGGNPELHTTILNYINNNYTRLPGAIWMIMSSPQYLVN